MILEVFLRKNMGARYFSFGLCVFLFLLFEATFIVGAFSKIGEFSAVGRNSYVLGIFGIVFLIYALKRRKESNTDPNYVSFDHFSLSAGDLQGWFKTKLDGGKQARTIEIWLEPLPFLILGLVLMMFSFSRILGLILMTCSVLYSLSYMGAYALARDVIMDKIDMKIAGEELGRMLKTGMGKDESRGFRNRSPMPNDPAQRELLYQLLLSDELGGESTSIAH